MAQKDYVSRAKRGGQRKKTAGKKRKAKTAKSSSGLILLLIVIVAAFAGGLYYLKNGKATPPANKIQRPSSAKQNGGEIPPAPTKRWVYVDALVNPGVPTQSGALSTDKGTSKSGMSQEQQRILSMMESDRPHASTTPSATYNQQVARNNPNPTAVTAPPSTAGTVTTAPPSSQSWTLQCGSFRNKEGAESIKAQLALAGIASQIVFSANLHRVIVGPYKTKDAAIRAQGQIKNAGVSGCNLRG